MNYKKHSNRLVTLLLIISLIVSFVPSDSSANHHVWDSFTVKNLGDNSATIQARILEVKNDNVNQFYFEYTTDPTFSTWTRVPTATTAVGGSSQGKTYTVVTKDLSGLTAGLTYYYRTIFNNSGGVPAEDHGSAWSQGNSFTTTDARALKASPETTSERVLSDLKVTLTVRADKFITGMTPADIILVNPPPGITKATSVSYFGENTLEVRFDYTPTDFDTDQLNFHIKIHESKFATSSTSTGTNVYETSNTIYVRSVEEVDGYSNTITLGLSAPTKVEMAGYNTRDQEIHINTTLTTDRPLESGKTTTFRYFVDVFDGNGNKIGYLGTMDAPREVSAPDGVPSVNLLDIKIPLTSPLTAEHRIVTMIKDVVFIPK